MIVCDICERNKAKDKFSIPNYTLYDAKRGNVVVSRLKILERSEAYICRDCCREIANAIEALKNKNANGV